MLPVLSPGWTTPPRLLSIQFSRLLQDFYFKTPRPWRSPEHTGRRGSEGGAMLAERFQHQQPLGETDLVCFPELGEEIPGLITVPLTPFKGNT